MGIGMGMDMDTDTDTDINIDIDIDIDIDNIGQSIEIVYLSKKDRDHINITFPYRDHLGIHGRGHMK